MRSCLTCKKHRSARLSPRFFMLEAQRGHRVWTKHCAFSRASASSLRPMLRKYLARAQKSTAWPPATSTAPSTAPNIIYLQLQPADLAVANKAEKSQAGSDHEACLQVGQVCRRVSQRRMQSSSCRHPSAQAPLPTWPCLMEHVLAVQRDDGSAILTRWCTAR